MGNGNTQEETFTSLYSSLYNYNNNIKSTGLCDNYKWGNECIYFSYILSTINISMNNKINEAKEEENNPTEVSQQLLRDYSIAIWNSHSLGFSATFNTPNALLIKISRFILVPQENFH